MGVAAFIISIYSYARLYKLGRNLKFTYMKAFSLPNVWTFGADHFGYMNCQLYVYEDRFINTQNKFM